MEKLIDVLVILIVVGVGGYWIFRVHAKIRNALIALLAELKASTNVDIFCREIKEIPFEHLKAFGEEEKEEIINYLRYMIRGHIYLAHLLASMDYYKLGAKKKRFISDYLFQALGVQGAASIMADIIYNDAVGAGNNEREKKFILNRCGTVLEFQEKTIKGLQEYQKSPLTKGFEASAIGKEMEKLQKEFTKKNQK